MGVALNPCRAASVCLLGMANGWSPGVVLLVGVFVLVRLHVPQKLLRLGRRRFKRW